jgi:hypothetical protein
LVLKMLSLIFGPIQDLCFMLTRHSGKVKRRARQEKNKERKEPLILTRGTQSESGKLSTVNLEIEYSCRVKNSFWLVRFSWSVGLCLPVYKEVSLLGFLSFFLSFLSWEINGTGWRVTESNSGERKEMARWGGWVNHRVVPGSESESKETTEDSWNIRQRDQEKKWLLTEPLL